MVDPNRYQEVCMRSFLVSCLVSVSSFIGSVVSFVTKAKTIVGSFLAPLKPKVGPIAGALIDVATTALDRFVSRCEDLASEIRKILEDLERPTEPIVQPEVFGTRIDAEARPGIARL
jgi:hypothetical protein